jgi:hypothetical protein
MDDEGTSASDTPLADTPLAERAFREEADEAATVAHELAESPWDRPPIAVCDNLLRIVTGLVHAAERWRE